MASTKQCRFGIPVSELYVNGILYNILVWLLLNISMRFIQLFVLGPVLFFPCIFIVDLYHPIFIYSTVNGLYKRITKYTTVNSLVSVIYYTYACISVEYMFRSVIAGSIDMDMLNVSRYHQTISRVVVPIYISTSGM